VVAVGVYGGDVDAGVVGEVEGDAASVGGPVGEEAGDVGEPLLVAAVGVGRPDAVVAQFGVEPCEADPPVGRLVACCCWQGAAQHGQYDGQSNRQGFGAHLGLPSPGVCAGHCGPPWDRRASGSGRPARVVPTSTRGGQSPPPPMQVKTGQRCPNRANGYRRAASRTRLRSFCGTTLSGNHASLRLPPQAARTAGPPRTRTGR
jgi:hypothetical protein